MGWLDDKIDDAKDTVDDAVDTAQKSAKDVAENVGLEEEADAVEDTIQRKTGVDLGGSGGGKNDPDVKKQGKEDPGNQGETSSPVDTVEDTVNNAKKVVSGGGSSGGSSSGGSSGGSSGSGSSGGSSGSGSGRDRGPGDDTGKTENQTDKTRDQDKTENNSSVSTTSGGNTQGKDQGSGDTEPSDLQKQSDWFVNQTEAEQEALKEYVRRNTKDSEEVRKFFTEGPDQPESSPGPTATNTEMERTDPANMIDGVILTDKELLEKANVDTGEKIVTESLVMTENFNSMVEATNLEEKTRKITSKSPVDVPYFDTAKFVQAVPEEAGDTIAVVGGLGGQTAKTLEPLNPTDGPVLRGQEAVEQGKPFVNVNNIDGVSGEDVKEAGSRAASTPGLVKKGGEQFAQQVKNNPEEAVSTEVAPEVAGFLAPGVSVSTTTTKKPSNVDVEAQPGYLPSLDVAKGEKMKQARTKEGAGIENVGQEKATGKSVSKQKGEQVQTEGQQPGMYAKAEVEVDGETKRLDYQGSVESKSESQVSQENQGSGDGMTGMFSSKDYSYEGEGVSKVEYQKIGEDGEVGGDAVGDMKTTITDTQFSGKGKKDPVMYEADPDGDLKMGFTSKSVESGQAGGKDYVSGSESTGIENLDQGVTQSKSKSRTSGQESSSKGVETDSVTIDTDKMDVDQGSGNKRSGNNQDSSSDSKPFKDLGDDSESSGKSMKEQVAEEMDLTQSDSDSQSNSQDSTDNSVDFDQSDYDGSGTGGVQVQRKPDSDTQNDPNVDIDSGGRNKETFEKALEDKISNKDFEVTKKNTKDVGRSVSQNDLGLDNDVVNDLDQGQDQGQDQRQEQPQVEEQDLDLGQSSTTTNKQGTDRTQLQINPEVNVPRTGRPRGGGLDLNLEGGEDKSGGKPLLGEKNRDYTASIDALVFNIKGSKKEYGIGTRPIVNDKKKKKGKDDDLFSF